MDKIKNSYKLDSDETQFFEKELEYVKAKAYEVPAQSLKAVELIPVSQEAPAGADTITVKHYDGVGVAKIVADYANDIPRVDVFGKEETIKVKTIAASYGYSIKEIRRAQMAGTGLETRRAVTARRAMDELIERIAWKGDEAHGIKGLINYPGISQAVNSNGKTIKAGTADEAVAKVGELLLAISSITDDQETPDTLLLPPAVYNYLRLTPYGDNRDHTILKYLRENLPEITTIEPLSALVGAGADGTDRMIMYERNPEKLTLEIPLPFQQEEAQAKGLEFEVPCTGEIAGVMVYRPLSIAFMDGV